MALQRDSYDTLQRVHHSQRAVKKVKAKIQPMPAALVAPSTPAPKGTCPCKQKLLSAIEGRGDLSRGEKDRVLVVIQEIL